MSPVSCSRLICVFLGLLAWARLAEARRLNINIPFLTKRPYTPLVFFTVPPGLMPEVDAMERAVRRVEKDLGVTVERLDVLREPAAEACLGLLTRKNPPFLYNRLTCQTISIPVTKKTGAQDEDDEASGGASAVPVHVDMSRLRAWAKNRLLTSAVAQGSKVRPPLLAGSEDKAIDQADLLEEATLTPRQREGKEKSKQRTYGKE